MTPSLPAVRTEALAPLVAALLERARRDAQATRDRADEEAEALMARAREEADALLADARAKGAADGAAALAAERMRAARQARSVALGAQRDARDDLRRAVRETVIGLRNDPQYPAMLDMLRARALRALGPGATVTEPPRGGILAEAGSQRLELSLDALADDVMDRLGGQFEEPWSP